MKTKTSNGAKKVNSVRFGTIEIHEHVIELGGSCIPSCGAPLTISWKEQAHHVLDIDEYETVKPARRRERELVYPKSMRHEM